MWSSFTYRCKKIRSEPTHMSERTCRTASFITKVFHNHWSRFKQPLESRHITLHPNTRILFRAIKSHLQQRQFLVGLRRGKFLFVTSHRTRSERAKVLNDHVLLYYLIHFTNFTSYECDCESGLGRRHRFIAVA